MTITRTAPSDYERRSHKHVVTNDLVKVCPLDAGRIVSLPPTGSPRCLVCGGQLYIYRRESEIARLRLILRTYGLLNKESPWKKI